MRPDFFYVSDIRAAGICMSAARGYFKDRAWSWDEFLDHGRNVADLAVEGDVYALKVVEVVKHRSA